MDNGIYLFAAYGIIWAVIFGYVLLLVNRQNKIRRDINHLKDSLKDEIDD